LLCAAFFWWRLGSSPNNVALEAEQAGTGHCHHTSFSFVEPTAVLGVASPAGVGASSKTVLAVCFPRKRLRAGSSEASGNGVAVNGFSLTSAGVVEVSSGNGSSAASGNGVADNVFPLTSADEEDEEATSEATGVVAASVVLL